MGVRFAEEGQRKRRCNCVSLYRAKHVPLLLVVLLTAS